MGLFKRGRLEEALISCGSCGKETSQKYVGQNGTPWQPKYYYRCFCGTMNTSKIRVESTKNDKPLFQKVYNLFNQ